MEDLSYLLSNHNFESGEKRIKWMQLTKSSHELENDYTLTIPKRRSAKICLAMDLEASRRILTMRHN